MLVYHATINLFFWLTIPHERYFICPQIKETRMQFLLKVWILILFFFFLFFFFKMTWLLWFFWFVNKQNSPMRRLKVCCEASIIIWEVYPISWWDNHRIMFLYSLLTDVCSLQCDVLASAWTHSSEIPVPCSLYLHSTGPPSWTLSPLESLRTTPLISNRLLCLRRSLK